MTDQGEDLAEVMTIAVQAMAILRAIKEDLAVMRGDLADMRRRVMEVGRRRGGSVMTQKIFRAPAMALVFLAPGLASAQIKAPSRVEARHHRRLCRWTAGSAFLTLSSS